jgi:RNA polymerase sigma factor for flagellar operon FliA
MAPVSHSFNAEHFHGRPMISMQGVPSSLIARNESWVRRQAQSLIRRLPSNVEKADLIQVGLIAVAQSALSFEWEGDRDTEEAKEAFARYARMRVKGAMLDELRQMDHLGRAQRRKVNVIRIARERWRGGHGADPSLTELSKLTGIGVDEIASLEQAARAGQTESLSDDGDTEDHARPAQPATAQDEVEARVDTGILLRRLERFFAGLPERERQVIDAYLGVGMTPIQLADSLKVSPSRVSQMYKAICERIAGHFGHAAPNQRSMDRQGPAAAARFNELLAMREAELARSTELGAWGEMVEGVLGLPREQFGQPADGEERVEVNSSTRWG